MIKLLDLLNEADTNLSQGLPELLAVLKKYVPNIAANNIDVKHNRYVVNDRIFPRQIFDAYSDQTDEFKRDLDAIGLDYFDIDDEDRRFEVAFYPQKETNSIGTGAYSNSMKYYVSSTDGRAQQWTIYDSQKNKIKDVSLEEIKKLMNAATDTNWSKFQSKFDKTTSVGKHWKYWKGALVNVAIPGLN